jgi:Na+/H+-dicarboxylate symporter
VVVAFLVINQGIQLLVVLSLYPAAAVLGGVGLWTFAKAVAPVQLVAVSTRSSLSTMPVQIESGRKHLSFGPRTTGFLVPLCVTLFKITALVSHPARLLFLAHVFGVSLSPGQVVTFLLTILLINFGALGIPRGSIPFQTLPAYAAVGIPLEGFIILQASNDLEDYPDTVANATGMFAAATALSRGDRSE